MPYILKFARPVSIFCLIASFNFKSIYFYSIQRNRLFQVDGVLLLVLTLDQALKHGQRNYFQNLCLS